MTRRRLDLELVRRGLVATRGEADDAIEAGRVTVAGRPAVKPETLVAPNEPVAVRETGGAFASRGGEKLAAALDRFGVDPSEKVCLDAGASTGGFTDVLLSRGARQVIAVDVGYGQLAWHLRTDDRVVVMERTNARDLSPRDLPSRPNVVTADLSFISLAKVVPTLVGLAGEDADLVLLVKPQFEAPRREVGSGGVVEDAAVWRRVIESVMAACRGVGAEAIACMASPLPGPSGNVEFFIHARVGATPLHVDLARALSEGQSLRRVKGRAS